MRAQPLLQFHPHFCLQRCRLHAGPDATDQAQPVVVGCIQVVIGLQKWFRAQWQKKIGWMVAQGISEEIRRSDSYHGKWLFIDLEDAADDGRTRSIPLPP